MDKCWQLTKASSAQTLSSFLQILKLPWEERRVGREGKENIL